MLHWGGGTERDAMLDVWLVLSRVLVIEQVGVR